MIDDYLEDLEFGNESNDYDDYDEQWDSDFGYYYEDDEDYYDSSREI